MNTPYEFKFGTDETDVVLCERELTEEDIDRFSTAIEEEWYGELFVDDLPMWIFVGEGESEDFLLGHTDKSKHWLFTHFVFTVGMNGDRVVSANVTVSPERRADITLHDPAHEDVPDLGASKSSGRLGAPASGGSGAAGGGGHGHSHRRNVDSHAPAVKVRFTYSVRFVASDTPYEARMAVYEDSAFLPATLEIHWLSIINSLVLVVLLTAFLGIILLRVVRNDFTRYMRADDEEEAAEEETGWKLLHGDVFRPPANLSLFAAMVGTGVQLLLLTTALLSLAFFGAFSLARRGSIVAACIVLYVLTTCVGAYVSARLYKQMRGGAWVWNVLLSLMVVPVPITATFAVLNTTALVKNSTAALPWGTIAVVVMLFAFLALPLGVLGGIAGHHSSEYEPPCRVAKVPRQIPAVHFYRSLPAQLFMAGFLPFSAISIELHYIFASVWGHKVYTLYGILFLGFALLVLETGFITVALTYFQLASEDHRWWWRSFLSGGAVGVFLYAYCVFYFFNHSGMSGFLQTSFYFLYMADVAFAFTLMMGAVGFFASWAFVRYIYSSIKTD